MPRLALPWFLVAYCCFRVLAMTAEANITLDDSHPAISYLPAQSWSGKTSFYHPRGFAYNQTWHEATSNAIRNEAAAPVDSRPVTMVFSFIGTAVYLFSLQPQSPVIPRLSVSLDGQTASLHHPLPSSPVFSLQNLENGLHNVVVTVEPGSTFLFDYLIYTTVSTTPLVVVQARQDSSAFGDNQAQSSTQSASQGTPSATSGGDSNSGRTQIGAIAGAIAASIGITSLFLVGLAISVIKIKRQRLRVRRESQRSEEINRSRGLTLFLPPPASHRQLPSQRRLEEPESEEPPPYESVVRSLGRNALVLPVSAQPPYIQLQRTPLQPIEEISTEPSRSTTPAHREISLTRESSSGGAPPSPPGLRALPESPSDATLTVSQEDPITSTAHSDHDHQ